MIIKKLNIGFALTGSFCTFRRIIPVIRSLKEAGHRIVPIMSYNAYQTDTRFGKACEFTEEIESAAGEKVIATITQAEPIGPQKLLDVLVIAPCTGNSLAKLAVGIADTPVTLAAKSHLRNLRPLVIAISSNDALAGAAKNIGMLQNYKNVFFVPYRQDDPANKPNSVVAEFSLIGDTVEAAMRGEQLQPVLLKQ